MYIRFTIQIVIFILHKNMTNEKRAKKKNQIKSQTHTNYNKIESKFVNSNTVCYMAGVLIGGKLEALHSEHSEAVYEYRR